MDGGANPYLNLSESCINWTPPPLFNSQVKYKCTLDILLLYCIDVLRPSKTDIPCTKNCYVVISMLYVTNSNKQTGKKLNSSNIEVAKDCVSRVSYKYALIQIRCWCNAVDVTRGNMHESTK